VLHAPDNQAAFSPAPVPGGGGDVESSRQRGRLLAATLALVFSLLAPAASARHPIPESERWATITHPGNEAFVFQSSSGRTFVVGRVDHEYQISRTEVTAGEWVEFARAYAPYVAPRFRLSHEFTGQYTAPGSSPNYVHDPGTDNRPVEVGGRFAARYCNWLHNGKANTAEAFERADREG
jgi:hypothetical protein